MLTVYGIPNCDSCRKARKWLDANSVEHRFHDLRKDGVDRKMLDRWVKRVRWRTLLNTRSATWRKIPTSERENIGKDRAIELMLDLPTLIKRPVLEFGKQLLVGFSESKYQQFLIG